MTPDGADVRTRTTAEQGDDGTTVPLPGRRLVDVAVPGETDPADAGAVDEVRAHAAAGATWWVEAVHPWRFGYEDGGVWPAHEIAARVAAGPPVRR